MKKLFVVGMVSIFATLGASAQEWAKARLEKSPRHMEWVKVKHGDREVDCWIAFPEVKEKVTAVIVINEIFGLTDWVRGVTDQLAEEGYIAIAPDFLTGTPGARGARGANGVINTLSPEQITADLNAAVEYVSKLPACNGKVVVAGFCWGGRQSFRYATNNKNLKAAFVFYGDGPSEADVAHINCPVYGFYAEMDGRIGQGLPKTTEAMKKAGKTYDPVTYSGAGHGFMREGEDPGSTQASHAANVKAREDAWKRWKELLKKI